MAQLEQLLKDARGDGRIHYMVAIRSLRRYLRDTPEDVVIEEIESIIDVDLFRFAISAGLRSRLQEAVAQRIAVLA